MNPIDSGKKLVIEDCRKVDINDFVRMYKTKLKRAFLKSKVKALGENIGLVTSKTGFGGFRFWFACPLCEKRVGVLLEHPLSSDLACRKCLGLEYRSRIFRGMLEEEIANCSVT